LFWDGGGANLESVSLAPLHQQGEMGWQNLKDLETRLRNHAKYPKHFQDVFGTEAIEIAHVLRALAQYQRRILHTKSRWDKWKQGLIDFSAEEVQGWVLFQKHCDVCHTPPLFSDFQYHLVAADSVQHALALDDPERGRARISQQVADEGAYRTPTLRGLNKTWPYLHDGRFKTLEQLFFAPDFDSLHAKGMLSQKEKMLLINFLKALN
jgi:cytochrome c peroxidase